MQKEVFWSRYADSFEELTYYVVGKRNVEEIQNILATLKLSGNILELGCGNGAYSTVLSFTADRLYITDVSEQMIEFCKKRFHNLNNAVIEQQDCFELGYPDNTFDSIVMVNLLHVIPKPEKAIKESKRVLKDGGKLVVVSFTSEGMNIISRVGLIYRYLRAWGKPPASSRNLTVNLTKSILQNEGFAIGENRLLGRGAKAVFVCSMINKNI